LEFIPSLCHSAYGIGQTLWATAQHPIDSSRYFANSCYEFSECFVDYCRNLDWDKVEEHADQLTTLYKHFDRLSDAEKGRLIGHIIGKFGIDAVAGVGLFKGINKGVEVCKKLKNINKLCNLEALAAEATKDEVINAALAQSHKRGNFFETVEYNFDHHTKHTKGRINCKPSNSIMEHPDPELLLKKYAGKGRRETGVPGEPGYRETVDFEEIIGIWKTEKGLQELPTTRGTIHYGKKGAHIVPAKPKEEIEKLSSKPKKTSE
jgi:hypothetical protein